MRFTFFISKKKPSALVLDDPVLAIRSAAFSEKPFSFKEPVTFIAPNFSFRSPPEVGRFSRQFRRIHRFIGSSFDSEFRGGRGGGS